MSDTDTLYQQTREHLHTLGLAAAADRLAPALETAERDKPGYTEFLHDMLEHEVAALHERRLAGRLRFAKLPARKTLEQFDYTAQPGLDRRLIDDLATLRFIEEHANVSLIGPPGVGKTMLATALGYKAVEAGYRAYHTTSTASTHRATEPPRPAVCRDLTHASLGASRASGEPRLSDVHPRGAGLLLPPRDHLSLPAASPTR